MLASLSAAGIVFGLMIGRWTSYYVLAILTPALWTVSACSLCKSAAPLWALAAFAPVVAMQTAFLAGAHMRFGSAPLPDGGGREMRGPGPNGVPDGLKPLARAEPRRKP